MRFIYSTPLIILFYFFATCFGQEAEEMIQPRKIISAPTAGTLPKSMFDLDMKIFPGGGFAVGANVGLTNRLNMGAGWGMDNLINSGAVKFFMPGVSLKYRLVEESYYFPALALGFENTPQSGLLNVQGDRQYFKSKGIYAAVSKNYLLLGHPLGFHGGINYSVYDNKVLEKYDFLDSTDQGLANKNDFINLFIGMDKSINEELAILLEYDLAMDDNLSRNPLKGFLNGGIRYAFAKALYLELDFRDLLGSKTEYQDGNNSPLNSMRELRIVFLNQF